MTALKAGEDRAILLGLSMIFFSIMMYFVLGITMVRSYSDRYDYSVAFKVCMCKCFYIYSNVLDMHVLYKVTNEAPIGSSWPIRNVHFIHLF